MKLSSTIVALFFANYMFAQIDSVGTLEEGQDTRNLSVISEDLFACNCNVLPDTFNFGLPRPLDNDFFMIEQYGIYLTKRYGLDMTKYDLGMLMYKIFPPPEGELLKDIWVGIKLSKNVTEYAEDYYQNVEFYLPLCALEELYRSSGKGAINAELAKLVEFDLPRQRMYWERYSKN
jgi:hypothetical protein